MELWIRSQNKERIVKVDYVVIQHEYEQKAIKDNYGRIIDCITGKYKYSAIVAGNTFLGTYKSKERASEVLDEIHSCIQTNCLFELYSNMGSFPDDFNKKWNCVPVYEMPKE